MRLSEVFDEVIHLVFDERLYFDAFFAGCVVAIVAPWLGTLLVLRRMPFFAVAVPQVAGAGVAFAFYLFPLLQPHVVDDALHPADIETPSNLLQLSCSAGATLIGLLVLALAGRSGKTTGTHAAVLFVVAYALSEVFVLESAYGEVADDALHHGRLLSILPDGRDQVIVASIAVMAVAFLTGRCLLRAAFDSDLARLQGIGAGRWLFITLLLVGALCSSTVNQVGPEVVLALLVIPPAVLRSATPSLALYAPACSLAGLLGMASSFVLAVGKDWHVGPALILSTLLTSVLVAMVLTGLKPILRWMK